MKSITWKELVFQCSCHGEPRSTKEGRLAKEKWAEQRGISSSKVSPFFLSLKQQRTDQILKNSKNKTTPAPHLDRFMSFWLRCTMSLFSRESGL